MHLLPVSPAARCFALQRACRWARYGGIGISGVRKDRTRSDASFFNFTMSQRREPGMHNRAPPEPPRPNANHHHQPGGHTRTMCEPGYVRQGRKRRDDGPQPSV